MAHRRANKRKIKHNEKLEAFRHEVAHDFIRDNLVKPERNKALEEWGREIVRDEIYGPMDKLRAQGDQAFADWARDVIKRDNKRKFPGLGDEELAADRRERETWPVNDYVLGAALMLIGAIVLIAIALATGLVKP